MSATDTPTESGLADLPVMQVAGQVEAALAAQRAAVLVAEPGAGKTTGIPLALLDSPWLAGQQIMVLQPRRVAARAAARRIAELLGEPVGRTAGYRVRGDRQVSAATRIEVCTEAILTRRLQHDPELAGIGLVIFDEFHERSLDADLALALTQEVRGALRDDLAVLVMSATLQGIDLAPVLGGVQRIESTGRQYPVETRYVAPQRDAPAPGPGEIAARTANGVRRALAETTGSVLAFLPGAGEIREVQRRLEGAPEMDARTRIRPLYGALAAAEQDRAIAPAPAGERKVVLATTLAQTSLTIPDIRVVVDSGFARASRYDPDRGLARLETVPVSRASADQRRGRAGRLAPGVCYRLWAEGAHGALPARDAPEIQAADLAPLALELAVWGVRDPQELAWLDPPPAKALAAARDLLQRLGALARDGTPTEHGRRLAEWPLHPRLAQLVSTADDADRWTACVVAALLNDPRRRGDAGLDLRRHLDQPDKAVLAEARELARQFDGPVAGPADPDAAGRLLAAGFPDRIGQLRRQGQRRLLLSGGKGAALPPSDAGKALAQADFVAVAELDGRGADGTVRLAAPLSRGELRRLYGPQLAEQTRVFWDETREAVAARQETVLESLVLHSEGTDIPDAASAESAVLEAVRASRLARLPMEAAENFRGRVAFLRALDGEAAWPDFSLPALEAELDQWLAPYLAGCRRQADLDGLDIAALLHALLDPFQQAELARRAPAQLRLANDAAARLDYRASLTPPGPEDPHPPPPVMQIPLKKLFGCRAHPHVDDGRIAVQVEPLSPGGRAVQVTRDLPGFWESSYAEVRRELKGSYPRHSWPADPIRGA